MKKYVLKNKKILILAVGFGWLNVIAIYFANLKIAKVIDLIGFEDYQKLTITVVSAFFLIALALLSAYISTNASFKFSTEITAKIRLDYLSSLYQQPTSLYIKRNRSEYITDIDANLNQLRLDYLSVLPDAITGIGQAIIYMIGLWYLHPLIFLSTIIFTLLPSIVSKIFGTKLSKLNLLISNCNEKHINRLHEILDGYLVIKQSKHKEEFLQSYHKTDMEVLNAKKSYNVTARFFNECMFSLNNLTIILVILIGTFLINRGQLSISKLVASMAIVSISTNAIASAFRYAMQLIAGKSLKEKIMKIITLNNDKVENSNNTKTPQLDIDLCNIGYKFNEKTLFNGLSTKIEKGKSYAVIGESGAGKSTFAKILIKINSDYNGSINFENGELKEFSEDEIFQSLYYIPQQPIIFRDTLKNNITMFANNISEIEYKSILKAVNLEKLAISKQEDIIEPNELSGGEMKRIELARALFRKAELIIFDEPTSGLDPQNAAIIEDLIFDLKNIIVITHNHEKEYLARFDEVIHITNNKTS